MARWSRGERPFKNSTMRDTLSRWHGTSGLGDVPRCHTHNTCKEVGVEALQPAMPEKTDSNGVGVDSKHASTLVYKRRRDEDTAGTANMRQRPTKRLKSLSRCHVECIRDQRRILTRLSPKPRGSPLQSAQKSTVAEVLSSFTGIAPQVTPCDAPTRLFSVSPHRSVLRKGGSLRTVFQFWAHLTKGRLRVNGAPSGKITLGRSDTWENRVRYH